jgi:hypothetical protein
MQLATVRLGAPPDALEDLAAFYAGLGLATRLAGDVLAAEVGPARLELAAAEGRPFYHFALLAPGDRFGAAKDWLAAATELLPAPRTGETEFAFDFWDAMACYGHDPAGNIVEVIAHADIGATGRAGPFAAGELLGISEIGVVTTEPAAAVEALAGLGLELWSGTAPADSSGLGFVGRKAHTLIVCMPGRGWLPTGRPAELHAVDVTLTGGEPAEADLPGGPVTVRRSG